MTRFRSLGNGFFFCKFNPRLCKYIKDLRFFLPGSLCNKKPGNKAFASGFDLAFFTAVFTAFYLLQNLIIPVVCVLYGSVLTAL